MADHLYNITKGLAHSIYIRLRDMLDGTHAPVIAVAGTSIISEAWEVEDINDVTNNDSDKQWTVPANTEWQVLFIGVTLATTATVGNRQMEVVLENPAGTMRAVLARAGVTQAASLTNNYLFAAGAADLMGLRDGDYLTTPLPNGTILQAGDVLRVYDNNAVDAAADDMPVHIQVAVRTV